MRFSPEWWTFWAGVWAVVLTAGAALAGIVSWYFSNKAASATEERTRALELRIAEQQERAAKAEQSLLKVQQAIKPRMLDHLAFLEKMKGAPKGPPVDILYKENDEEAHRLALQIQRWLGPGSNGDGVGWTITRLRPLKDSDAILKNPDMPTVTRAGFWVVTGGVGLVTRSIPKAANVFKMTSEDDPAYWLLYALQGAGLKASTITEDRSLPQNFIRVVVGPKQ
jgi:hypothetical protein